MDFARDRSRTIIERAPLSMPRAVVVAAAVGCAFGLGVVSARAAGNDPAEGAVVVVDSGDALARADARTKAYDAVVKGATSTWHAELTSPVTVMPVVLPTKYEGPVAVAADADAVEAVAVAEQPSSSPTVDDDVVRAVEPVEIKVAKTAAEPAARDNNEDRDDQEGDADVAAPKPERLAAALNKVLGEKAASAAVDNRRYAVQLSSTPKKDAAASVAAGFVQKGFAAKVVAADVPGKGTMYRVRVNGLATRAAADAMKARLGSGLVVTDE